MSGIRHGGLRRRSCQHPLPVFSNGCVLLPGHQQFGHFGSLWKSFGLQHKALSAFCYLPCDVTQGTRRTCCGRILSMSLFFSFWVNDFLFCSVKWIEAYFFSSRNLQKVVLQRTLLEAGTCVKSISRCVSYTCYNILGTSSL